MRQVRRGYLLFVIGTFVVGIAVALLTLLLDQSSASASVPCTRFWTGRTNSLWSTATNWSSVDGGTVGAGVPSAGDFVCMSTNPTQSAVLVTSNRTVGGIDFGATDFVTPSLFLPNGTFTVNGPPSTINNMVFGGGTLGGSADVDLTGDGSVQASSIVSGTGIKTVAAGATMTVASTLQIGMFSADGTFENDGTMTIAGTNVDEATSPGRSTFTNTGTLNLADGAALTSPPRAGGGTAGYVINTGTVSTADNTANLIGADFANQGTVEVGAAGLSVSGAEPQSLADTGTWDTGTGAGAGLTIAGIRSSTAGTYSNSAGTHIDGGALTAATGVTFSGLDIDSGTLSGSPSVDTFTATGGTLTGGGTMTLTGASSSLCTLTIDDGSTLLIDGTAQYDSGCGTISLVAASKIENAGTFNVFGTGAMDITDDGSAAGIVNDADATLVSTLDTASETFSLDTGLTNAGTVSVSAGKLAVLGGNVGPTEDIGTYQVEQAAVLAFGGGARTLAKVGFTGPGLVQVTGGNVSFAVDIKVPRLDLEGGGVSGSVDVVNATFNGTRLSGGGTMTTVGNSVLKSLTIDTGYTLRNQAVLSYPTQSEGSVILNSAGRFVNAKTLNITGAGKNKFDTQDHDPGNAIVNIGGGIVNVNLAAGTSSFIPQVPLTNNGTLNSLRGTLYPQGGVTNLSSGVLTDGNWVVNGGTVRMPGPIATNAATITVATVASRLLDATTGLPALVTLTINNGTLTLGQTLQLQGDLTNTGAITLLSGSSTKNETTLNLGSYEQSGSALMDVRANASLSGRQASEAHINAGTLTGAGKVKAFVRNFAGTVVPGDHGAGTLAVTGAYEQDSGATLAVTPTSAKLTASGGFTLGGTLIVVTPAPAPAPPVTANILAGSSIHAGFTTAIGTDVPSASAYWALPAVSDGATAYPVKLKTYPTVSVTGGSVTEGNSGIRNLQIRVTLSELSQQQTSVHYATSDGTATAPHDYLPASGSVTFDATPPGGRGGLTRTVSVPVNGDTRYENNETVHLDLSAADHATIAAPVADGVIMNDDTKPQILIGDASVTVSAGHPATMHFLVALYTKASGAMTTVNYTTSDGTAVAGTDYTAESGTLTIPAGDASTRIDVPVAAPTGVSGPTTFTVTLSDPVGATLGDTTTATGTIYDSNSAPARVRVERAPE